ncbi:archaetidylserine decarboxylase [Novosphingobium album (ex Liu et al. 2023)]|uniref:phosphatidylserine decarboxylase n=1 Tax=Novosphingobium album (ex Liu et al. 2023) TaxID=3031130 RepID=A0ABT5WSG7_9SPHN|nr:archaetidylserine decarboxylase [Novosphingobium album (ex Liu et al. 2023)]MDE8652935.1 archaetidylserine decarboxylase [Novosphingobium album (ex Liu et al. 2023)]
MSLRSALSRIGAREDLNFLLTNRIPRHALTRFMGWFSKLETPPVRDASLALWRLFCDVDLTDAAESRFPSLHAAFIRRLREGARAVDADPMVLASPSDAIVGAFGRVAAGTALQIKGMPYALADLVGSAEEAESFRDGWYVTLRLTAGMYHRFHAPHDLAVEQVRYISGDTWNVNPIALKRVERLFCRNERAPIAVRLDRGGHRLMLVPVAAVLVASIRLPWLDAGRNVRAGGEGVRPSAARFAKGEEMGWFEHGSTIVVLAPASFAPAPGIAEGRPIRMGEALLHLPG